MPRLPIVSLAIAATLLLAACTAPNSDPAEPLPEGSVPATSSPTEEPGDEVANSYLPCDAAIASALNALSSGELLPAPSAGYYPDYLPLPSCVIEDPDFGDATVFFVPATQTDFDTLQAAIVSEQGAGVPSDGQGLATDGALWAGKPVPGLFLVPPGYGVTVNYIFIQFELP